MPKQKKNKQSATAGNKRLRLRTLKPFITWPQCDKTKDHVLQKFKKLIEEKKKKFEFIIVAQEKHQDGKEHIHLVAKLATSTQLAGTKLDGITGKRGNYQSSRVLLDTVNYVIKDGDYLVEPVEFDLKEWIRLKTAKKNPKSDVLAKRIINGESIMEIAKTEPGYVMTNLQKMLSFKTFHEMQTKIQNKPDWNGIIPNKEYNDEEKQIIQWIEKNVKTERKWTDKHLFIHGSTQLGKTTLARELSKTLRTYFLPMDEEFYDGYSDEYDLIILEEFKHHKRLQWMNRFLDGNCHLRIKGGQVFREKCTPVIILSNYSLAECYPKVHEERRDVFETLNRRLLQVEVDDFIKIKVKEVEKNEIKK